VNHSALLPTTQHCYPHCIGDPDHDSLGDRGSADETDGDVVASRLLVLCSIFIL
jgi:hypothetical protein